jgi:hypothetical protein
MPVLDSVRQVHTVTQLRGYVGELMCDDKISGMAVSLEEKTGKFVKFSDLPRADRKNPFHSTLNHGPGLYFRYTYSVLYTVQLRAPRI